MDILKRDLRHAVRSLARSPLVTGVIVVTIALGIGATTAVFSVVDQVLLAPLPYREPGDLVVLRTAFRGLGHEVTFGLSRGQFVRFRERSRTLESLSATAALLAAAALAATWLPARRATAVDPLETLRVE